MSRTAQSIGGNRKIWERGETYVHRKSQHPYTLVRIGYPENLESFDKIRMEFKAGAEVFTCPFSMVETYFENQENEPDTTNPLWENAEG